METSTPIAHGTFTVSDTSFPSIGTEITGNRLIIEGVTVEYELPPIYLLSVGRYLYRGSMKKYDFEKPRQDIHYFTILSGRELKPREFKKAIKKRIKLMEGYL